MSDINEIKQALESKEASFLCECAFAKAPTWLASLLTTIESQKEALELKESEYQSTIIKLNVAHKFISSQKEEIENLKEMKIKRIEVENGAINFSIQGEAGMSFAAILLKFYEDNGGKNFFTFDVEKDGMRLSIIIENKHGELTVSEKLNQQSREIESLKAITELAVKGLEKYGDMIVLDSEDRPHDVGMVARETLFEIEKLSQ